jgi:hypothetical protein
MQEASEGRVRRYWSFRPDRIGIELPWGPLVDGELRLPLDAADRAMNLRSIARERDDGSRLSSSQRRTWRLNWMLGGLEGASRGDILVLPAIPVAPIISIATVVGEYSFDDNELDGHSLPVNLAPSLRVLTLESRRLSPGLRRALRHRSAFKNMDQYGAEIERLLEVVRKDLERVALAEARLAPFLEANPLSSIRAEFGGAFVERPWGDESFRLQVVSSGDAVVAALNEVFLPPRLTALWHRDTHDLEVTYTALPVDSSLRQRSFTFHYSGQAFDCGFSESSKRLLDIAAAMRPTLPPSRTEYRNLVAFRELTRSRAHLTGSGLPDLQPVSFWIRNIEWDEEAVLDLARHLNFYMRYFDLHTPQILIHDEHPEEDAASRAIQLAIQPFPSAISAHRLDPYLLAVLDSAVSGRDPLTKFLYGYQVLEYAAFYNLQDAVSRQLQRILAAPDTLARPLQAAREVIDVLADDRSAPEDKMNALLKDLVDPAKVWIHFQANLAYFCAENRFDGGFTLPPLLKEGWGRDDFAQAWLPKVTDQLRKLRNALVHSREARQARVVQPTMANYERLEPWIPVVFAIAAEVVLNMPRE